MKRLAWTLAVVLTALVIPASPGSAADDLPTGSIAGVVRGDVAAVNNATVYLSPAPGEDEGRTAAVGPDGSYRFDQVPPAQYLIRVAGRESTWTPDFFQSHPFAWYASNPVTVVPGQVAVAAPQRISEAANVGHIDIVDPDHNQGDFSVWDADDPDRAVVARASATNSKISSFPLAPGRYKLQGALGAWFEGRSFDSARVYTVSPGQTLTVVTPPLNGRSLGGSAPLPGVLVTAYAADDPTEVLARSTTDDQSRFHLGGLSPSGTYKLRAVDPSGRLRSAWYGGTTFTTAQPVQLKDGFDYLLDGIAMERIDGVPPFVYPDGELARGTVKGTVSGPGLDLSRNGIKMVAAENQDAIRYESHFGAEKIYEFEPMLPGDYKMMVDRGVWVGGRSFAEAKVFQVRAGQTLTEHVDIPLSGQFQAQVLNPNGRPIPGVMVEAHTATGADEIVARATPDQYGVLNFHRLPLAPYAFRVVDASERYAGAWIGGGTSLTTAPSFVPRAGDDATWLPDTFLRPILHPLLAPSISGTSTPGNTLTATSPGTWSMTDLTFRGQWLRDGSPITGETSSTYQVRPADISRSISYRVEGSRTGQATRVAESRSVIVGPTTTVPPSIKPVVGKMRLKPGNGRRATKLRVTITASGVSRSRIIGTVLVRDRLSSRQVSAVMRNGSVTISLRRLKNGPRRINVSFNGPS
jgi:hypothetical protein